MPRVAVLIPCYNASATLPEALDSLARQTLIDYEIVAVDDGSTDATLDTLRTRAVHDRRLTVIARPHAGIVDALNSGLAACHSPYVARMDADDRCLPERLACQAAYLDVHPDVAVVGCQVRGFPEEQLQAGFRLYIEWLNSLVTNADIRREMFVESPLVHPSVMFRRETVLQAGGYQDHGWPEDYDLWLRLFVAGAHFARLPDVLLEWREYPERLTRTDERYTLESFLRAKAYYLAQSLLVGRDAVIIWGAGAMGRRLGRQIRQLGIRLSAYVDVDPRKAGRTRQGCPIYPAEALPEVWARYTNPIILAAVGTRGARPIVRQRLCSFNLHEGEDWWFAA